MIQKKQLKDIQDLSKKLKMTRTMLFSLIEKVYGVNTPLHLSEKQAETLKKVLVFQLKLKLKNPINKIRSIIAAI